jgi:hypothetical protein
MSETEVTINLSRADAEVLLGVVAAERHNPEADAVCEAVRRQLDEQLANPS